MTKLPNSKFHYDSEIPKIQRLVGLVILDLAISRPNVRKVTQKGRQPSLDKHVGLLVCLED